MKSILLLNGPNLNQLGKREPHLYGNASLDTLVSDLTKEAKSLNYQLYAFQSHSEAELINKIHQAKQNSKQQGANSPIDFILINAGAFTHTSIALRDALLSVEIPFIELHLTNLHQRETFRQHSYLADIAVGIIMGFGPNSYSLGLKAAVHYLEHH